MADTNIGGIKFTVDGDDSGLKRVDESMEGLQKTAKDTQQDLDKTSKSTDKLGTKSKAAAKDIDTLKTEVKESGDKLKTATGYATAFTSALGAVTSIAAKAGKEINNMARLSGTSVEEFQKLAFGANEAGISAEKLGDIYKDTQDKVGEFLNSGGGELVDYFEKVAPKVGQTAEQFRGLSGPQALGLFQKGLEKANVSAVQQITYLESLANDASLLTPLLANNGKGFSDAAKRMEELNLVLSQADVDSLVEVDKAFNELGTTISKNTQLIVAENSEDIIDAVKAVSEAIASASSLIRENMDVITQAAKIIGTAAAVWYAYTAAVNISKVALIAFNVVAKATPFGVLATTIGLVSTALLVFADNARESKSATDDLTGSVKSLTIEQLRNTKAELDKKALEQQARLDELKELKAIETAKLDAEKKSKSGSGFGLQGTGFSAKLAGINKDIQDTENSVMDLNGQLFIVSEQLGELSKLPPIEITWGSGQDWSISEEAQKLIDKYNPLLAKERELLEEQKILNDLLRQAGKEDIPAITSALEKVKSKLVEVRKEMGPLQVDKNKPISIFDVGANVSDDYSDVITEGIDKAKKDEAIIKLSETLGDSIESAVADAIEQGIKTGSIDKEALLSGLGKAFGTAVGGPIGGAVGGALGSVIGSFGKTLKDEIQIAFEDGVFAAQRVITKSGLFDSNERFSDLSFNQNEILDTSIKNSFDKFDNALEVFNADMSDFSATVRGDDMAGAIENLTNDYGEAIFSGITLFQDVSESVSDAVIRVADNMETATDAIRGVAGTSLDAAVESFISGQSESFETQLQQQIDDANQRLSDARSKLSTAQEIRATEYDPQSSGGDQSFAFGQAGLAIAAANKQIEAITNEIGELVGRVGLGLQVASAEFATNLESLIDGGDVAGALNSLSNVIATDTENYQEKINNAQEDLEALGFDSVDDFVAQFKEAQDGFISEELLANFANGAVIIEGLNSATESLNDELEDTASSINDLQQEYNELIGRSDLNDLINYEERLADARNDEERQLIKNIRYQELLNEARDAEIDTLADYVGLLGTAASTALDDLREGFDSVIEDSADNLDTLRDSLNDKIDVEQERADNEVERLQNQQDALSSSVDNAKALINILDSAMNTLGERSEDLQEKLFTQSFSDIQDAINKARSTGELPDPQLIEGAVSQLATAGAGGFDSRVDREREALQARKLLSDLNDLSEDSLTDAEQQIGLLDDQIAAIESGSEATIKALNLQITDAEEQHKQLVERFDAQYDAQKEYYDSTTDIFQGQLDALNGINTSFDSFEQLLSEIVGVLGNAVGATVGAGSQSGVTNQEIAEYLKQFTADNFISGTEAQAIYNKSVEFGVSSSLVNDILNSQLTGGSSVNVSEWLNRNNLASVGGNNMNSLASAINTMSATLGQQLTNIESSSNKTASVLDSAAAPGGFGLVVQQS